MHGNLSSSFQGPRLHCCSPPLAAGVAWVWRVRCGTCACILSCNMPTCNQYNSPVESSRDASIGSHARNKEQHISTNCQHQLPQQTSSDCGMHLLHKNTMQKASDGAHACNLPCSSKASAAAATTAASHPRGGTCGWGEQNPIGGATATCTPDHPLDTSNKATPNLRYQQGYHNCTNLS
jgi:hypothetical protein